MINTNWVRWLRASIDKHFSAAISIPLFIEGQHRDTKSLADFAELRMDGPDFVEVTKNYYQINLAISILIQSTKNDTNYHRLDTSIGIVTTAFTTIEVFKLGIGVQDTGDKIGCLSLTESLQVLRYGQLKPDVPLVHASVEGRYKMVLEE